MASLLSTIPKTTHDFSRCAVRAKEQIIGSIADSFEIFIPTDAAFTLVEDFGDYNKAKDELVKLVVEKLDDFGVSYTDGDILRIIDSYDVADGLDSYFNNSCSEDDRTWDAPAVQEIDEIDDLFERT